MREEVIKNLENLHEKDLKLLMDAIYNAKLPVQNYSLAEGRAFNNFKELIIKSK